MKPLTTEYKTHRGLPPLAGLCSMERASRGDWSVERSVERLKRLHYVLRRSIEILTSRITSEPIYELKTAFSHHAYLCAEHVTAIRTRVGEMREPPLGLDKVPHEGLERWLAEVEASPSTESLVIGLYGHVLPSLLRAARQLQEDAHPLSDAPTVRLAKWMAFELEEVVAFGSKAIECLVDPEDRTSLEAWERELQSCLDIAGGFEGSSSLAEDLPARRFSSKAFVMKKEPQRDERFIDPFNAGVNPEAFLYDERYPADAKTLMMYYKRIRELDVPEMMATILHDLRNEEPWEFFAEMIRQLWDEARHAMFGEVGFVSLGMDWTKIPINFTWSRNLNLQLNARERHGVLFFIEQGLMPKTGKRYEWEVGLASGDALSAMFQDFDWADEVLHAQIGRRWYVPRYGSLNEALDYGDRCWSQVLSHWAEYRAQGLTEHRNWWPELYEEACRRWNKTPDPLVISFQTTYQEQRADLKVIES